LRGCTSTTVTIGTTLHFDDPTSYHTNVSTGQSDFNILLLVLPLGSWFFLFSFLLGGYVFPFFFFYHISNGNRRKKQTAPSTASGKRKCDDTNSTYEHTNIPQQPNTIFVCKRLWFLRVLFFLFFYYGMEGKAAYIGIEGRRKEVPWKWKWPTQQKGKEIR
jgi:hypothetical protein